MTVSDFIELYEFIQQINFGGGTMLFIFIFGAIIIEKCPAKIYPLTWLSGIAQHALGLDEIKEDMMDARRTRIIRFDDELLDKRLHRKDMFDAILIDCDKYERYCKGNQGYVNSVAGDSISHIKEVYHKLKQTDGFLIKREDDNE